MANGDKEKVFASFDDAKKTVRARGVSIPKDEIAYQYMREYIQKQQKGSTFKVAWAGQALKKAGLVESDDIRDAYTKGYKYLRALVEEKILAPVKGHATFFEKIN